MHTETTIGSLLRKGLPFLAAVIPVHTILQPVDFTTYNYSALSSLAPVSNTSHLAPVQLQLSLPCRHCSKRCSSVAICGAEQSRERLQADRLFTTSQLARVSL